MLLMRTMFYDDVCARHDVIIKSACVQLEDVDSIRNNPGGVFLCQTCGRDTESTLAVALLPLKQDHQSLSHQSQSVTET